MSDLESRIEKLEAQLGMQNRIRWFVAIYAIDDPDQVTVNGVSMTRAELNEYASAHGIHESSIVYLPANRREDQI